MKERGRVTRREGDEEINDEELDHTSNRANHEVVTPQDLLLNESVRTQPALSKQHGNLSQEIESAREGTERSTMF
jgi:hypothetical protein